MRAFPKKKTRAVVVGAGFAGLRATRELMQARRDDLEVVVVDKHNHHTFTPLLYQVATSGLSPSDICFPVRELARGRSDVEVVMARLTEVDYAKRRLFLDDGELRLDYDYLVLALGGKTSYFGNDQWRERTFALKSVPEAEALRDRILSAFEQAEQNSDLAQRARLLTFVIIGGGPTGVELAGAIAELRSRVLDDQFRRFDSEQARVVLLEGNQRLLKAMSEQAGRYALERLKSMGVEVYLGEIAKEVTPGRVVTPERRLEAATVIWAAGVGGCELAEQLAPKQDRDRGDRLKVASDLRLSGHDRVYCIGDMAHFEHDCTFDGKQLPGLAPVAMQQGRHAARNILRQLDGRPTRDFHYTDKGSMATVGRTAAAADLPSGRNLSGPAAWLAWLGVHLYYLAGLQNRVVVSIRWLWAYLTWRWGSRLIRASEVSPAQGPSPSALPPERSMA